MCNSVILHENIEITKYKDNGFVIQMGFFRVVL